METSRPKTVTSALPPYIGIIDGKYLVAAEKITEITEDILSDARAMAKALKNGYSKGFQNGRRGLALAHPQVNTRPWAFFVSFNANELDDLKENGSTTIKPYLNPEIIEFGGRRRGKDEMCLSFPFHPKARVDRWEKVKVRWQEIEKDGDAFKLSQPKEAWIEGKFAQIWQHEMEHLLGGTIYGAPMW